MKHRLNRKFWFSLAVFGLMGQIAWVVENMYFNVFIYKMFRASPADISMMVGASAVAAAVTTWLMGALSDKVGKRKIFICGGYIMWGFSILLFALIRMDILTKAAGSTAAAAVLGVQLVIIMDCVMTFFGSTANDAAFNAWMTDYGDITDRGSIEGINSMMPLIAILVVFGGFMSFDLDRPSSWVQIYLVIGAAVIAAGVIGIFTLTDKEITPDRSSSYWNSVIYSFRPEVVSDNRLLYAVVESFAVFNISIQIFMPYLILYYEKTLGMKNYVFIMAPAIILAALATGVYGRMYDRLGFKNAVIPSVFCLMAGYVFLYFFTGILPVFIGSLLMMTGYLTGMAAFGAMIKEHIPREKAGMFQGLRIFGQVLVPGVIGPWIAAELLRSAKMITNSDGTQSFIPGRVIFLAAFIAAAVLLIVLRRPFRLMKDSHYELWTGEGIKLAQEIKADRNTPVWDEYPRPQLKRESYFNLNGMWECAGQEITVPFAPQSMLSGYKGRVHRHFTCSRRFRLPENFLKNAGPTDRVLLHFGAVDQIADVAVNGVSIGRHKGGYNDFTYDCTDVIKKNTENELAVKVTDTLSHDYPYGKQRKDRGGMWYTPVSGIWKSVWMECVPWRYIREIKITPDLSGITLDVDTDVPDYCVEISADEDGRKYTALLEGTACEPLRINAADLTAEGGEHFRVHLWTPDDSYLYRVRITAGSDTVSSYFALRTVTIENRNGRNRVCLNGEPIYLNGVLDQGYYSDGLYTPASPSCYLDDIKKMKELGFNMLRKHIKIEPDIFYYYCDTYGMLVMQDMVNNGFYRHFHDTLSPNVWLFDQTIHPDRYGPATGRQKRIFTEQMEETVWKLYNHPCIIAYTIFNEGWGQFDSDELYEHMKELDPTRLVDSTSGWFRQKKSDFDSRHIYFHTDEKLKGDDRPLLISECGGFAYKPAGHTYSRYMNFGYGIADTKDQLFGQIEELYEKMIFPAIPRGLCGSVYTQVSDVEDEINGLTSFDRADDKGESEKMCILRQKADLTMKKAAE